MELNVFEIFMWKYGLNIFGLMSLFIIFMTHLFKKRYERRLAKERNKFKHLFMILLIALAYGNSSEAKVKVGFVTGTHLMFPSEHKLNDNHVFVELYDHLLLYQNSFDKGSVALYGNIYLSERMTFKLGLTSGYYNKMEYKGAIYENPLATSDGISAFFAATYEYKYFLIALMGNSINAGIKFDF